MAEQTWEEWVKSFNAQGGQAGAPGAPVVLPAGPGTDVLSGANRANIAQLFDPTFGRDEMIMAGAEAAIGGGWGAGGAGLNFTNRLLDSERKANFVLGAQLLEPYLQRESAASLQASDNAARLNQIAAEGAAALQRLQLSEAGATARLNAGEAAALQRAVLAGNQAVQQITLREAGETGRQRTAIQGDLASTLLKASLSGAGGTTSGGGGDGRITGGMGGGTYFLGDSNLHGVGVGPLYNASREALNLASRRAAEEAARQTRIEQYSSRPTALGSSSIDALLKKYGLLP